MDSTNTSALHPTSHMPNRTMDHNVNELRSALSKRLRSTIASRTVSASDTVDTGAAPKPSAEHRAAPKPPAERPGKPRARRRSEHQAYRHRILQVIVAALLNPIYVDWDIKAYAAATPSSRSRKFPHPPIGKVSKPATLVDINGVIIMWYLPGMFPDKLHKQATAATLGINRLLSNSVKPSARAPNANWRINKSFLVPKSRSRTIPGGSVNFSGGWFAQGHTSPTHKVLPSRNLRTEIESKFWLNDIRPFEEYLNAVLAVTHPRLYDDAKLVQRRLQNMDEAKEITALWPSVFTGIAVIANRITPSHRDRGGRAAWYDTLLNIGSFTSATFRLPDLGAVFSYPPGTIINLCGNIMKHEVGGWGAGDRVCYAHFMRDAVFRRFGVDNDHGTGWVEQQDYDGLCEFLASQ